jgi:hypothetical protein
MYNTIKYTRNNGCLSTLHRGHATVQLLSGLDRNGFYLWISVCDGKVFD